MPIVGQQTKLDLDVFVVSRSRFDRSDTLEDLKSSGVRIQLVVPAFQVRKYENLAKRYNCQLIDCPVEGISLTRQYCGKISKSSKFIMFDDDLRFYRRVSSTDWHLRYLPDLKDTALPMLQTVSTLLNTYAHCSVGAREGNNRIEYPGVECSRPLRALAYQKDKFLGCIHGRVKIMEDFDITLQLLRKGYKNFVMSKWAQGQKQTQMAGGCSDYRTKQLHEDNVKIFAKLHEGFVKIRQKTNKTGGEFGSRLEATIYWQKAYQSSQP